MVDVVQILVEETSASTGVGVFTLSPRNARRSFNQGYGTGGTDKFYYFITHETLDEWEHGTGHLSASTTLVRDTIILSSNANALVNFSAGTKDVVSDRPGNLPLVIGEITNISEVFTSPVDYTPGVTLSLTLANTPSSKQHLDIYFNGVKQSPTEYSLLLNVITFNIAIPLGVTSIETKILNGGGAFTSKFVSADVGITAGGLVNLVHGLGVAPVNIIVQLVNVIAEANYTVGQTTFPAFMSGPINGTGRGVSIIPDATNLVCRYGSDANTFLALDALTGVETALTNANWNMRITAWV